MKNLICITGPTASGKTALSIALAQKLGTEIISSDSMQIYRSMDIGTAKPSAAEQKGIRHHMIDIIDPGEPFSVARYTALADTCVQTLLADGKIPIVVGGTGLYLDSLIEGNAFTGDETDFRIRQKYETMAQEQGNLAVHACLAAVDPQAAERLHPNNRKRVIRALEVFEQTGMTLDAWNQKNKRAAPKYDAVKIGLCPTERDSLSAYQSAGRPDDGAGTAGGNTALWESGQLTGTAAPGNWLQRTSGFFGREVFAGGVRRNTEMPYPKLCQKATDLAKTGSHCTMDYIRRTFGFCRGALRSTDYLAEQGIQ